jgi:hypothetical protein
VLGEKLVKCHVVGDYMKMLQYMQKLDRNHKKKDYYLKLYKEENKIVRK